MKLIIDLSLRQPRLEGCQGLSCGSLCEQDVLVDHCAGKGLEPEVVTSAVWDSCMEEKRVHHLGVLCGWLGLLGLYLVSTKMVEAPQSVFLLLYQQAASFCSL